MANKIRVFYIKENSQAKKYAALNGSAILVKGFCYPGQTFGFNRGERYNEIGFGQKDGPDNPIFRYPDINFDRG